MKHKRNLEVIPISAMEYNELSELCRKQQEEIVLLKNNIKKALEKLSHGLEGTAVVILAEALKEDK